MKDVLENEAIKLDWNFRMSLVYDIVKVRKRNYLIFSPFLSILVFVLSPTLFLLYINDLLTDTQNPVTQCCRWYQFNMIISPPPLRPKTLANEEVHKIDSLNNDLEVIAKWGLMNIPWKLATLSSPFRCVQNCQIIFLLANTLI